MAFLSRDSILMADSRRADTIRLFAGLAALLVVILIYRAVVQPNITTVALSFLLIILVVAASSRLWVGVGLSLIAGVGFNFFFLPPVHTFAVADPENWAALCAFLGVSLVASSLSAAARDRAAVAIARAELVERRKEIELSQRSAELNAALLSSVAHNLRTPLAAIRVAASNLQASWLDDAQRAEQSRIVLAEVERLTRLFENILDVTRIDAGVVAPTLEWVHPMEIVEHSQRQVGVLLHGRKLVIRDETGDCAIQVDPRLTSAALAHLLENAAQYSPPDSTINVVLRISQEGALFSVEDEGPGVSPDDMAHLFERFYRGREARRYGAGTGMGLSIAKGLIAAENGRVWAQNRSVGSSFSILIPAETRAMLATPV